MNKAILVGNLGQDAELKVMSGGDAVLNFSVATSEKWTDKQSGEKKEKTEWHRCALWGKRAEALAPHLTKGTKVVVEGKIETRSYEKDGEKRYATSIKVNELEFAGGGNKPARSDDEPYEPAAGESSGEAGDAEIPF